ncbi:4Fe-4S ferredoxin, iron-sulfur binding domain protein [Desulforamulus reducens MI-1]|uniref:4Fe-4S ferredoxin, iron-sulfur binding domain protein n=1 Tax=Desulforamulus reducens (strain ATCC BAA-1160 / DSM 100696 / MI-1) TaxID=349161 RepID=A4J0T6_DESRM|nr:4Fe-4S dicluster domain-containing protein [Desulforamulus reducens]ABO48689.1 4Fe-4S ferredoxin, iron-sulfur binding domain protein [Desulforamulus reducens MI-1]ABO48696.1 4Fe-4S ferredoxin, iron-sulfur binding domain protein [Desulforamulus reducens MI-1]
MILNKSETASLLDKLANEYRVIAPVEKEGLVQFAAIQKGEEAKLDYMNAKKPGKEILFPQSEELYSYTVDAEGVRMQDNVDPKATIVFGMRPCDVKSMVLLDNVFKNDQYEDVYYLTRRANTLIVGLGCNEPSATCFCSSMSCGPFAKEGSDIFLTDIGEAYVVEGISEKGKELLAKLGLAEASAEAKGQAAKLQEETKADGSVNIEGLAEKLGGMFEHPYWDSLYEKCLGCGACTYLCPTCHCFDIADEATDCNGCRVRNWDACMFPLFTLHGSGHNPRPGGKARWRQRLMHKFNYFVERYNATACVGCGRCIKNCPVNLDIRQVLADVRALD